MTNYVFDTCALVAFFNDESGADAVVLSQATIDGGIVVTSDHHELDEVEHDGKIKFLWVR